MPPSQFTAAVRSFWHTMTSDDRHATPDSAYRSISNSQRSPGVGRNPGLQSVTSDSHTPYSDEPPHSASRSSTFQGTAGYSPRSSIGGGSATPTSPYTPGMRSNTAARSMDGAPSEIPLQDFNSDGTPPAPPVSHSWKRIDRWAEDNYPELLDQMCEGATVNDLNELENDLDCSLPLDLRESLAIHDGQERGGTPTGIIFSAMLMDCEEILDEWKTWQKVLAQYLSENRPRPPPPPPPPSKDGEPGAPPPGRRPAPTSFHRASLQARQDSQPDGAVRKVYCHPGWIPLVRDWGGNNIGIDLAPGPTGAWGQVIMFGRDFDCKYVVASSWAHFLANVADDLESTNWYVDDESGDLKLRELRTTKVEPSYLEILRIRADKKYGRRPPPRGRKPMPPVATGSGMNRSRPGSASPSSPMIRLSPTPQSAKGESSSSAADSSATGSGAGSGDQSARSQTDIHAPTARPPLAKVLEEAPASPSSDQTPTSVVTPARSSLQSSRDENSATPASTATNEPSSASNTPSAPKSKPATKDLEGLDKTLEDVSLNDDDNAKKA